MRATLAAAALAAAVLAPPARAEERAHATLRDAKGGEVGTAALAQADGGVRLVVKVTRLPPGTHAVHVHAVGKCDDPEFKSAGPHFNPGAKKHGWKNPEGHHAGDLPNLTVAADGTGALEAKVEGVTLGAGAGSLLGPEGTALVVHASPDDEVSDPAGNAGARIACGVVTRGGG